VAGLRPDRSRRETPIPGGFPFRDGIRRKGDHRH
jgi:hypothetical protein